jgi:hypothetical protein
MLAIKPFRWQENKMGHWNHRVVKKVFESGEEQYSVREVFYNDNGDICAYTEDPIDLACESLDGLREYIQWCLNCLDKPILEDGKVVFAKDDYDEEELNELKASDTGDDVA